MSFKAKDLQFDNSQPAFLQRLRGQLAGNGDADRHEQPIPRNKRMKQDDEDDAPTYVIEDTNQSLTKEEYDALISGKNSAESEEKEKPNFNKDEKEITKKVDSKSKENIAEVGMKTKKRKAAKVISEEPQEDDPNKDNSKPVKKPKKKSKTVKLAFDDEDVA